MISEQLQEQVGAVYDASEARKIRVLPGRVNATGRIGAVVAEMEYRRSGEVQEVFATPLGLLIGDDLVSSDGLTLTEQGEDAFDALLMHLRNAAFEPMLYQTKAGRTVLTFKSTTSMARTKPLMTLPWWGSAESYRRRMPG